MGKETGKARNKSNCTLSLRPEKNESQELRRGINQEELTPCQLPWGLLDSFIRKIPEGQGGTSQDRTQGERTPRDPSSSSSHSHPGSKDPSVEDTWTTKPGSIHPPAIPKNTIQKQNPCHAHASNHGQFQSDAPH